MNIQVNGKERTLQSEQTIAALLQELGLDAQRVVVERNRQVVPRREFERTYLADGDRLEILQLVGGG